MAHSAVKHCSTGVPQGPVIAPLLLTFYTNKCRGSQSESLVIKFSDNRVILSLLCVTDPSGYHSEINSFQARCNRLHLILNTSKSKERIFDPRGICKLDSVVFNQCSVEQLGIDFDVDFLCAKLSQRLHFLHRLCLARALRSCVLLLYSAGKLDQIWDGNLVRFARRSVQI